MPETAEVICTDDDCVVDLFETHYTYDLPAEFSITDLVCPGCGQTEPLDALEP